MGGPKFNDRRRYENRKQGEGHVMMGQRAGAMHPQTPGPRGTTAGGGRTGSPPRPQRADLPTPRVTGNTLLLF